MVLASERTMQLDHDAKDAVPDVDAPVELRRGSRPSTIVGRDGEPRVYDVETKIPLGDTPMVEPILRRVPWRRMDSNHHSTAVFVVAVTLGDPRRSGTRGKRTKDSWRERT
jgi:hypothetical protein